MIAGHGKEMQKMQLQPYIIAKSVTVSEPFALLHVICINKSDHDVNRGMYQNKPLFQISLFCND